MIRTEDVIKMIYNNKFITKDPSKRIEDVIKKKKPKFKVKNHHLHQEKQNHKTSSINDLDSE
jgi:hypothetical protein